MRAKPLILACCCGVLQAGFEQDLALLRCVDPRPHFERRHSKELFYVDGKPFIALAVELPWYHTIYGRYRETMDAYDYLYSAARRLGLNTIKVPVKWSQVEPRKGEFDFSYIDHVKAMAERNGLKVILGWFGHYASGRAGNIYRNLTNEVWAPMDVIEDERAYPRAVDASGRAHHNAVSYDADAVIEREAAAFAAFMRHIREVDSNTRTVVMIQVENEIAVFGANERDPGMWRDHSPRSNALFAAGGFRDDLKYSAERFASNWLRRVTGAGGEEYPIPFYMDFIGGKLAPWMVGGAPGEDAATYLKHCPFVKFIAMNLYVFGDATIDELRRKIEEYRVSRNITAISETNSDRSPWAARLAFLAVGEYGAPLFCPWALNVSFPEWGEPYVLANGELANGADGLRRAYVALRSALLPIALASGEDRLKVFLSHGREEVRDVRGVRVAAINGADGQAMVIHSSDNEFLVIGWRSAVTIQTPISRWPQLKRAKIEAGRWDGARWIPDRTAKFLGIAEQSDGVFRIRLFEEPATVRISWM